MADVQIIKTGDTRVFTIRWRASPVNAPVYQPATRAMASSRSYGDVTQIQLPSGFAYDQFDDIDQVRGEKGRITVPLQSRYQPSISDFLTMAEVGCPLDIHVPIGRCKDPKDFNLGWDVKKLVFEDVFITTHDFSELGALESSQRASVMEDIDASARVRYELKRLNYANVASVQAVQEVIDIRVCDSLSCGACGLPSDGCSVIFALTLSAGGSPGLPAEVLYSVDGGATWADTLIDTLGASEDPNEFACVGSNLVVISEDSESLHYASLADITDGVESWNEVSTGFVTANGPLAIFSTDATHTWIVGENGYVYFSDDPTSGVEVQSPGDVTSENLNDVHGADDDTLVAVGANNAVIVTTNGGVVWSAITGPAVGVVLNTVFVKTATEWWVGDAGGNLWYTVDGGTSWTQKRFSGDGFGQVRHIEFATDSVGFMAHDTATPAGRIFRTDNGGQSWYRDSDATNVAIPANDRINRVATCRSSVPQIAANLIFGAGLADDDTDGIVVKGA